MFMVHKIQKNSAQVQSKQYVFGFVCLKYKESCYLVKKMIIRSKSIKTHGSESRGQEEAGCTRRTSELFTRSTALKFVNALNKPP